MRVYSRVGVNSFRNTTMKNLLERLETRRLLATFTVTNTNDSGTGSLPWAVQQANATPGANNVNFNIPGGGVKTINLSSALTASNPITLDATTQPGYSGTPLIRIHDAGGASYGISLNGYPSAVRGFSITGFGGPASNSDGVGIIVNVNGAVIEKNFIGLRPDGTVAGNESSGISVAKDNVIVRDNIISGNGANGVHLFGSYNKITGNKIGTDPSGTLPRPNAEDGIYTNFSEGFLISGNLISGNAKNGIRIGGLQSSGMIKENRIGTTLAGNGLLRNTLFGVHLDNAVGISVGSANAGNRFGADGILVSGGSEHAIDYNTFGIGAYALFDLGATFGIRLDQSSKNFIRENIVGRADIGIRITGGLNKIYNNSVGCLPGNKAFHVGNDIGMLINGNWNEILETDVAHNSLQGVWIEGGSGNAFTGQSWDNGKLPLDIGLSGANVEDYYDDDTGANDLLNSPFIKYLNQQADGKYRATLEFSAEPGDYQLTFYASDEPGNTGVGELQTKIATRSITINNGSYYYNHFDIPETLLQDGRYLSATLTKSYYGGGLGSTSEPSASIKAVGAPAVYASYFDYENGHSFRLQFSQDVSASLNASDITLTNTTLGQNFSATSVTWDSASKTARWSRSTPLPDGNYTLMLKPGAVKDPWGNANISNFPFNFKVLAGDANRDGTVNFDDLLIIAQNYGTQGRKFSQGNFNYDAQGKVDFDDLLMLAQRYGNSLFSAQPVEGARKSRSLLASDLLDRPELA